MFTVVMTKHEANIRHAKRVKFVNFKNLQDVMIFLADNFGGDCKKFHFFRDKNKKSDFYIHMIPMDFRTNEFDCIEVFGCEYGESRYANVDDFQINSDRDRG